MVLCACWICIIAYIQCHLDALHVVICRYCVWCMIVHVVLWVCGVVYMSCMWRYAQVVSCICHSYGVMYMWHSVHIIQVV